MFYTHRHTISYLLGLLTKWYNFWDSFQKYGWKWNCNGVNTDYEWIIIEVGWKVCSVYFLMLKIFHNKKFSEINYKNLYA